MFKEFPAAKEVFDEIGRQGRALGVRMLMGSQRLGHEMNQGIMANVPIRAALRTLDGNDSRAVLGVDEAKWLPVKPAGAGYLRVEGRELLTRFQTAYVSGTYIPRRQVAAATVRAQSGYAPPREFLVTGMAAVEQPAPVQEEVVEEAPQVLIGEDGRPMRDIQVATKSLQAQTQGRHGRRMWLPPLTSLAVDELVRRLRGKPWHVDYGQNPGLVFPVGVEDRPFQHSQRVFAVDVLEGNCGVVGIGNAGKTVALTTMITGAALMYTPQRIQFLVLSFSGPDLNGISRLPHVASFARGNEVERVTRTLAEMEALIEDREQAFKDLGIGMAQLRERKFGGQPGQIPDDPYGDVYMVLDGWAQFVDAFDDNTMRTPVDRVVSIMTRGPSHGVHVIVSANGWIQGKMRSGMKGLLTANVELKLNDQTDDLSTNNQQVAKKVPFGSREVAADDAAALGDSESGEFGAGEQTQTVLIRGRGTSMAGYHFQTALPQVSVGEKVVRVGDAVEAIAQVTGDGGSAAKLKILPAAGHPARGVHPGAAARRDRGRQGAVRDFGGRTAAGDRRLRRGPASAAGWGSGMWAVDGAGHAGTGHHERLRARGGRDLRDRPAYRAGAGGGGSAPGHLCRSAARPEAGLRRGGVRHPGSTGGSPSPSLNRYRMRDTCIVRTRCAIWPPIWARCWQPGCQRGM